MRKKLSILALGALIALPAAASANPALESRIDELSRQLEALKAEMAAVKSEQAEQMAYIEEVDDDLFAATVQRFHWSGDFRSRYDAYSRSRYTDAVNSVTDKNSSLLTNRLRLGMYAQVYDNLEFVGRLAMHKAFGMQNNPSDGGVGVIGGWPAIDGNTGRALSDNKLLVDRAVLTWFNIGGTNVWFSIGRRPTTDGDPAPLRQNIDTHATPMGYMDWPFDGLTIGYAFDNFPSRIRFCYGRGFESGLRQDKTGLHDTDFMGISWDVYRRGARKIYFQSFVAMNVFNYPDMDPMMEQMLSNTDMFNQNPDIVGGLGGSIDNLLGITGNEGFYNGYNLQRRTSMLGSFQDMVRNPRENIGNIYHTSALYMDKVSDLDYFVGMGWSRTNPNRKHGMFNDSHHMMAAGMGEQFMNQMVVGHAEQLNEFQGTPGWPPAGTYTDAEAAMADAQANVQGWMNAPGAMDVGSPMHNNLAAMLGPMTGLQGAELDRFTQDTMAKMMTPYAPNNSSHNGWSFYTGVRYDISQTPFKVGMEYNYGSKYWLGMSPGHDDIYGSKLATRGHVWEIYGIYDIPGVKILGNAFMRAGYQYYRYNYTGSMDWNIEPYSLSNVQDRAKVAMMQAGMADLGTQAHQAFTPQMVRNAHQFYLTFEASF